MATHEPAERFHNRPFMRPAVSDCPTATHVPAAGHATLWISMLAPAGVPAGVGAVDGVHAPAASVSMSPCSTPDTR